VNMPPGLVIFLIRVGFPATVKQLLSIACFESRNLGHNFIGSEHVLCALVRLPDARLRQILAQRDADIERIRRGVVDVDTWAFLLPPTAVWQSSFGAACGLGFSHATEPVNEDEPPPPVRPISRGGSQTRCSPSTASPGGSRLFLSLGFRRMKTAVILLTGGLVIGLVVPYILRDVVSGAGVQLPQFIWSKTPPRSFSFSVPVFFRVVGIILVALAIVRFILVQRLAGR